MMAALMPAAVLADTGKLRLTGGVSTIDGAAGGGITPWALIGTQATEGEWGASAFLTRAVTKDYALTGYGAAYGWRDRLELSVAKQEFDAAATGLAPGLKLKQDIVGLKWRLAGEAVLDSDRWMPQIAVGVLHKRAHAGAIEPVLTGALGARMSGTDVYLSATKLFLAQGVLVNGTLRATKANQNGLLGFGSKLRDGYRLQPEISVAMLLRRDLAVGFEVRGKPDNLNRVLGPGVLAEDDWKDVFLAWAPSKHASLTLAWVDLGRIAPPFVTRRQTGWYLSGQVAF
jgi:hypothetical protein